LEAFSLVKPATLLPHSNGTFPIYKALKPGKSQSGENNSVAILDTGLASGGEEGIGCVDLGYDVVNGDFSPYDGDGKSAK
jgi:hypothetical protein